MEEYRQEELKKIKEKFFTGEGANDPDYDPHNYRSAQNGTNYFETLVHVIKAVVGTGILAMPNAFKNAGLFNGFLLTGLVGMLSTYGIHVVVKNQYQICKRLKIPYVSYPSLMRVAVAMGPSKFVYCGYILEIMVDTFIIIFQIGICTVYIIFVSVNLKAIIDENQGFETQLELYILAMFIPFAMLLLPPNLKIMAPFSLLSNIVFFVVYLIIMYLCFDGLGNISERSAFGEGAEIPFVMGTILFSTAAIGSVLSIERNMKAPQNFDSGHFGILNVSMSVIVVMYLSMGFMGYWKFGDDTKSVVTLNLDAKSRLGPIIQVMVSLAVFLSFSLNAYVPVEIVWLYVERKYTDIKYPLRYNYLMRMLYVIFTFILAVSIPQLDLVISLSGALCITIIQVIFPAFIDICLKWPNDLGRFYWNFFLNLVVMLIGVMALVTGVYASVRDIMAALNKGE